MAEYNGGSVLLQVKPVFRNLQQQVSREYEQAGKDARKAFERGMGSGPAPTPAPSPTDSRRRGAEAGGAFADGFRRQVDAALRSLPPVRLGVATNAAEQELRDLRADLQSLSGKTVGVDISSADALAEIERISTRLRELGAQSPDVQVRADTAGALAALEAIAAAARQVDGQDVDIDVNVDTSAAEANLNSFTGRLIALATIIGGLGPALIPIGAVGAGALAGIGTGAVAAGAGLGTLLLGVSGVGDAVKALGKAQEQQGKSAAAAGASAASSARAIASAQRGVESAEASLANTRANAAAAAENSAKRIADAQDDLLRAQEDAARAVTEAQQRVADVAEDSARRVESARRQLADAETRGAEQIQAALERQERAERTLADAQDSARQAQEDLNEARKTAAERLQDLSLDVTGAALRQRQAVLDVADAQETLAKVSKDPKSSKNDIAQAQLRYEQALQSLNEIGVRFERLKADKAAADAAGVEGADAVVEAQKRINDSAQGVLDAQKAVGAAIGDTTKAVTGSVQEVADAQANLTRAQQQSTRDQADAAAALALTQEGASRKVIEAQDAVVQATKAAAEQQRQSAFSIEQAQRSLIGAQESLAAASRQTGSSSSAALDNVATAMANLSPAGQAFALFLFSLQPAIDSIRAAAAQDLLPGLTTAIQTLLPALPAFNGFLTTMGGVLGNLAIQAAQALTGPKWAPFFDMIARTGGPTLELLAQAGGNLALALANLLVAFEPVSTAFIEGLADMAARFAEFTANLGSNEGFQSFLDYLVSSGPLVKDFFGALFAAIGNIITAMAPFGQTILTIVTGLLNFIAAIPPAVLQGIVLAVVGIVAAFNLLAPAIAFVGGIISAVSTGVPILGAVLAALGGPVTLIIAGVIALGAALVAAYQHSGTFRNIVDAAFTAIGDAGVWLWQNALKPAFEGIGAVVKFIWQNVLIPIFEAYKYYFQNVLGPVALFLWRDVIEPAWMGIRIAIDVAWTLIKVILGAFELYIRYVLAPVFLYLWQNVIKPAWDGISLIITTAWNLYIKPILDALGNYINTNVAPSFSKGVDAIGKAWEGIKEASKAPVRFVVERVINDGIIDTFNDIAAKFPGVDKVARVKLPEGFARGGVLPGVSSWRDGDDQLVPMRRGEGVAISEAMAVPALRDELLRWNAIGVRGGRSALAAYAGGGFAKGGIIGSLSSLFSSATSKAGSIAASAKEILADPSAAIASVVRRILALLPGADTAMGQIASSVPTALLDGIKDTVSDLAANIGEGVGAATGALSGAPSASAAGLVGLGRQLQALGFRVSEHPSFGGVHPVHAKNSAHYYGRAIDVNYGPGGENATEKRAIDGIVDTIRAAGFKVLWRQAGHFDHLHAAYDSGGYLQPGYTQVFNGTGKPEPVFTSDQWDVLKGAALGGGLGVGMPENVTLRDIDGTFIARMQTEADGRVGAAASAIQVRSRQGAGRGVFA